VDGVVGATDLGDGRVVLILDPLRVAERHNRAGNRT
jgi:chemotaxis protein histidine kinase CheA